MISRLLPDKSVRAHAILIVLGVIAGLGILQIDPDASLFAGREAKSLAEKRIDDLQTELDEIERLQREFSVSDSPNKRVVAIQNEIRRQHQLRHGSSLARRLIWIAVVLVALSSFYAIFVCWLRARTQFSRYTAGGFIRDIAYIVLPILTLCTIVGVLSGIGVGMFASIPIADDRWHVAHILDHNTLGFDSLRTGTTFAQLGMSLEALCAWAAMIFLLAFSLISKPKKSNSSVDNVPKVHAIDCLGTGAGALLLTLCFNQLDMVFAIIGPAALAALIFMLVICIAARLIRGQNQYTWSRRIWVSLASATGLGEIARLPLIFSSFDEILMRCRGLLAFIIFQRGATVAAFSCVLLLMLRMSNIEPTTAHYLVLGGGAILGALIFGRTAFGLPLVFLLLAPKVLWEPEHAAVLALSSIALVPVCALCDTLVGLTLVAAQNDESDEAFTLPLENDPKSL